MISTPDSEENSSLELPPPPQFEKVEDIMRMPSERLRKSPLVNVIGLVKDYQPPIPSKGTGMKSNATGHAITLLNPEQISYVVLPLWIYPHKWSMIGMVRV
jgi:hypothetical protein